VPHIKECDAAWTAAGEAAKPHYKAYEQSKQNDEREFEAAKEIEKKGVDAYRACMARRLPDDAAFPALLARAQSLADKIAGK
jgi:uncharacterized damage-inducible protein DinB